MTTEVAKVLDANGIATTKTQADQIADAKVLQIASNAFTFVAGFDGTNNIRDDPSYSGDTHSTAVGELLKGVEKSNPAGGNVMATYRPGPGTPGTEPGSSLTPTIQAIADAGKAYDLFAASVYRWRNDPDHPERANAPIELGKLGVRSSVVAFGRAFICRVDPLNFGVERPLIPPSRSWRRSRDFFGHFHPEGRDGLVF